MEESQPKRDGGDESANVGRAESELAGGNGEQRSRERGRVQSEADAKDPQTPFPKQAPKPAEGSAKDAKDADAHPSAPMSQSGAAIKDFE